MKLPEHHDTIRNTLLTCGILLESDAKLPSISSIIAGGAVRGSWWGHPSGGAIYAALQWLADQTDVTAAKLVSQKITYIHQDLWPALIAIGRARESWQMKGLSRHARSALDEVTLEGYVHPDQAARESAPKIARELETRLLIHSFSVHTESGAHAKCLESWDHWANRVGFVPAQKLTTRQAKKKFENALQALNERYNASGRLPW
jgi:hypothetical protein